MDEISLASIKRKNTINRIVFIILCVLIAFLLAFNIVLITNAYFTDVAYTNPSIVTTGNVTISYVVKDNEGTPISTPILLSDGVLIPGDPINYIIDVTNAGKNDCYIRMKLKFAIKDENDQYKEVAIVVMNPNPDSEEEFDGFTRTETVNSKNVSYIYYGSAVDTEQATKTVSFPIRFVISETENMELIKYTGKQYKITVIIEAIQAEGIILNKTDTTKSGWLDADDGSRISLFD